MSVERSVLNVERSAPRGAVFLSYASQDAGAAKRLCDALRAAGVEVWFDQSELRGGDAWDQSIRRQIKECALFIPVVSANTQARREGYFRLEWKLADDRTHLMAKGTRFILPVCIDETRDWDAIVPDSFTTVQWTRLAGGEGAAAFAERVKKLLEGESAAVSANVGAPLDGARGRPRGTPLRRNLSRPWLVPVILGAAAVIVLAVWQPWKKTAKPLGSAPTPAVPSAPSEAAQLAAKARNLYDKVGFNRDDLAVAEDLSRRATELEPDSAAAWGVRAGVQASYIFRNWDLSEKRRQDAQSFANRALALNPDETEALLAQSRVLSHQGANEQAETILRRVLKLAPDDNRARRALGVAIQNRGLGRFTEGRAELQEAVRRHPRDVLARYDLAQSYNPDWGMHGDPDASLTAMIEQLDAALAVQPFGSALVLKAQYIMAGKGDLATMRAMLDQLTPEDRSEDRAVFTVMWCGLLERKPERVIAASALTARNYFEDTTIASPKAWYEALAHRLAGQENQARLDWQTAEGVMRQRLQEQPNDSLEQLRLAITLAWLGRNEEAARLVAPIESAWREQPSAGSRTARLLAYYYAGLGDAADAVRCLQPALYQSAFVTPATLPLDPWWDKLRGQPEFEAFMAGLKTRSGQSPRQPGPSSAPTAAAASPAAPAGPADPQLRRVTQILDSTDTVVTDVRVAEDLVKTVLAARPTDVEATILMGRIQDFYLLRGFDRSEDRFALARQFAERSLSLAPDDPEALADLATYLQVRRTELPRAARLARQAIALRPSEPRYYRILDNVLSITDGVSDAEVIASARHTAELFPRDALVQYELARHYRDAGDLEQSERYFDLAIQLGPVANALIAKAELAFTVHGDLSGVKALPDTLPDRYRGTDRAVYLQFVYAMASGQHDVGLEALRALPEPWMIDFDYTGPTSLLMGEILLQQGKPELARLRFEEAQAEMGRHKSVQERNFSTIWLDGWILMRLGRADEARARNAVIFPELRRPFQIFLGTNWWFSPIPGSLLMGERAQALALVREAVNFQHGREVIRVAFRHDPRMAPWRDDREIVALLAAAGPRAGDGGSAGANATVETQGAGDGGRETGLKEGGKR